MYTNINMMCISLATTLRQRLRLSWVMVISLVMVSLGHNLKAADASKSVTTQNYVNFTVSSFESLDNLTLLGDAHPYLNYVYLNAVGTAARAHTCGRLMYAESVRLVESTTDHSTSSNKMASFRTFFTFSMTPRWPPQHCPGGSSTTTGDHHGSLAFVFMNCSTSQGGDNIAGAASGLCSTIRDPDDGKIFRRNVHMFAVEFEHGYIAGPYYNVGVKVNGMHHSVNVSSQNCSDDLESTGHRDFAVWIDFDGETRIVEVRLANHHGSIGDDDVDNNIVMSRPLHPLIAQRIPDIDTVLLGRDMYVGFTGSVSAPCSLVVTALKSWTFSSSGSMLSERGAGRRELLSVGAADVPSSVVSNDDLDCGSSHSGHNVAVIAGVSAACGSFLATLLFGALGWCCLYSKRRAAAFEQAALALWPRRFTYRELVVATDNFSGEHFLGIGGFGEVYKGKLVGEGADNHVVAVKRMKPDSKQGEREFSAEISVISQIRHRNLVQILGWCRENNQLLLVYEYMSNSSLDLWLFDSDSKGRKLTWNYRYNILRGLASVLAYLHEEWEQCIVHRDIKASNVMLDTDFNAHLGDFGLARLVDHDSMPKSTIIAGTIGYLAPELPLTRKATKQSDVYSYGVLALEIVCGRPVHDVSSESTQLLHDVVWDAHERENILSVADSRLHNFFDTFELTLVLTLGLTCCHPEPDSRPTMRFVHQCIIGEAALPPLPPSRPDPPSYSSLHVPPLAEFSSW